MRLAMRVRAGCITYYNCSVAHALVQHTVVSVVVPRYTPTHEELSLAVKWIAIRQERLLLVISLCLLYLRAKPNKSCYSLESERWQCTNGGVLYGHGGHCEGLFMLFSALLFAFIPHANSGRNDHNST